MIAYVEIDQHGKLHVGGAGGFLIPADLAEVVDDDHGSGVHNAGDFEGVGNG